MMVNPNDLLRSFNKSKMDSVVSGSKALVASSERMTSGFKTKALAIATL